MGSSSQTPLLDTLAARLARDPCLPVDHATASFWQDPPLDFASRQSPQLPEQADVVIIGSGITAISVALHLLRHDASLHLVMLEARTAISGATGRNGGHIKAVPWVDYAALKEELGDESARRITQFRLAHLDALVGEAEALGDAAKAGLVRRVEGVSAVFDAEAWRQAKTKVRDFLDAFPLERGRWALVDDPAEMQKLGIHNAVGCVTGPSGAAWPYRFLGSILAQMLAGGRLSLEAHTPALQVRRRAEGASASHPYKVHTARGSIRAQHVIHCTNAYAAHLLPALTGKLWPLRGQMTVQAVPANFPRTGATRSYSTMWARGFDYITQSPAADGALYLGGGFLQGGLDRDEDLGNADDSQLSPPCLAHLATVPARAFVHGDGAHIQHQWTGIMGFTGDGRPLVDRVPPFVSGRDDGDPQVGGEWIAAGWDGYGMVHCWLAGKGLAMMVTGRESELESWFPRREFACTKERLDKMSPERALGRFLGLL